MELFSVHFLSTSGDVDFFAWYNLGRLSGSLQRCTNERGDQ